MGDLAAGQPSGAQGEDRSPPERGWRVVLTSALTGAAGGMAVNDFTGWLGYRGLDAGDPVPAGEAVRW